MTSCSRRRFTAALGMTSLLGVSSVSGVRLACAAAASGGATAAGTAAPKRVAFADGRVVPAIGMGSWHIGQGRHTAPQEIDALQAGIGLGMSVIDTAEMYGEGRSESLIGRAIKARRDEVFLVSKAYPWHAGRSTLPAACDGSLSRLGTDHLDLYLLHWRGDIDIRETVEAFERLREAGKIRAWGVSNFDVGDMGALVQTAGGSHCATDQVLYNLASRNIEFSLLPWCVQHRMPIMAYSPLGSGGDLLSAPILAQIVRKHSVTPAAVALAWSIRHSNVLAIFESGDPAHIRENGTALTLVLDSDDLLAINKAFAAPTRKEALSTL